MKNRKIICIILMIFLTFFITKQAYAEQDNEINENVNINKMEIELTGVDAGKNCENKEAMVDVSINNANYVNGGTIQIKYDSDLTFVSAENKNENYSMEVVNNQDESILIIAFTSNEGQSGDIKLCSLKFRLPKTIKEEKYYNKVKEIFNKDFTGEFFDKVKINEMLDNHYKNIERNGKKIYTIYTFLIWYERFFVTEK